MPVFVDTNVLLYARDATEPRKQARAAAWLELLWRSRTGRLSYQVLQEFYVNLTRKLHPGLTPEQAQAEIGLLLTWKPIPPSAEMLQAAWRLEADHSLSFWDAMILAAARVAGCDRVLSEDMADGVVYDGVEVIGPFTHEPD